MITETKDSFLTFKACGRDAREKGEREESLMKEQLSFLFHKFPTSSNFSRKHKNKITKLDEWKRNCISSLCPFFFYNATCGSWFGWMQFMFIVCWFWVVTLWSAAKQKVRKWRHRSMRLNFHDLRRFFKVKRV